MLEKSVLEGELGDEWTEVWNVVTSTKAYLNLYKR